MIRFTRRGGLAALVALAAAPAVAQPRDALPSWHEGPAKQAIVAYVAKVTGTGVDFVPTQERIAVFDNDGTLWSEQPIYTQFAYALDRAKALASQNPSLLQKPSFAAAASGDRAALDALSSEDLMELAVATQAGLTPEAHADLAHAWLAKTRHPRFARPYTALIYQPQLELLAYLRAAGFRTYIVSGGDVQFMRTFAQSAYGVPPEQVIGTSLKTRFEVKDGRPVLTYLPELQSLDDGPGKPQNIALHIGRAPLVAVGNSDGDLQMLQQSAGSIRPSMQVIVHHDDATREFAYDRASKIGKLDKALDEAAARGWTVISMKRDWRTIFPPSATSPAPSTARSPGP